uniref:Uncharacterized protein n=1 Tax=Arundo donax TaxID=35708 RepID=A0A0A8Y955_ARUDO
MDEMNLNKLQRTNQLVSESRFLPRKLLPGIIYALILWLFCISFHVFGIEPYVGCV